MNSKDKFYPAKRESLDEINNFNVPKYEIKSGCL